MARPSWSASMQSEVVCRSCGGTGKQYVGLDELELQCPFCAGTGEMPTMNDFAIALVIAEWASRTGDTFGDPSATDELSKRERETAKRRELGLCLSCGKPSAPKATCPDCGRKANEARKRKRLA